MWIALAAVALAIIIAFCLASIVGWKSKAVFEGRFN
jgi:hypothetical protein